MFSASFCTIPKKQQLKTSSCPQALFPSSVPLQDDKYPQNIDIRDLFRWICRLWTAAVKHFIADSTWLIGILDEWAQNRFVNKWTISRLQASFLNQGKHNLVIFFNWEKTTSAFNRYILAVLFWQERFRNIGSWFYFNKHQDLSF